VTLKERPVAITRTELDGTKSSELGSVFDFTHHGALIRAWEEIHGVGSWVKNPWVWRVAFEVLGEEA
jgi:hypothetical protein